jgi:bifunctional non-homologous end joining protein LigD
MAKLSEYSAKRRFETTPEPAAVEPVPGSGPLLFVVQQHAATRLHYDFRIECDGVLYSWAVPKGPSSDPADKRMAVFVENHPYDYASFEGVIPPKQYGAGEVIVWDCGVYSPDEDGTCFDDRDEAERRVRAGLAAGKLSLQLRGEKLKGSWALVRTREAKSWLLIKHKDRFVSTAEVTAQDRSVLSGRRVRELKFVAPMPRLPAAQLAPTGATSAMPAKLAPMLAEVGTAAFSDDNWLWEPKLDGYRVLAFVDGDRVQLKSRRGLELAPTFPKLVDALREQAGGARMILDGEIVAFDAQGRPSFNALQNRVQLKSAVDIANADRNVPTAFFAFDLPYFAGVDLRARPYRDRHRYLAQCLLPSPLVQLVHAADDGEAMFEAALASGFEGVIGKRKEGRYEAGKRSTAWLKVKPTQSAEFVIGGYTRGKGSREALGALLVGYWDGAQLRFASGVGSGFDQRTLAQLLERLQPLRVAANPFSEKPDVAGPITWVRPDLVVEVSFQQWTEDARLRAPVFVRVRDDVDPNTVHRTQTSPAGATPRARATGKARGAKAVATKTPAGIKTSKDISEVLAQLESPKKGFDLACGPHRIRLSNLDRVYWPANKEYEQAALTKRDLLRYLAQVSPLMLPHLADRPLTMIRMPDGITGQRFFQKHWEQARPDFVESVTVFSGSKDERHEYLLCNNLPTLLWLAQSGTLEFHVWHSRAKVAADAKSKSTDYASSLEALEASVLNYPDYVVFDIDPYIYSGKEAKGAEPELNTVAFEKGKEIAFALRELLQGMGLEPIVKTSGKTGLHVFVPIKRTLDFDAVRHVCELVSRHLLRLHPKDVTMEWSVPKRSGKIFLDHNMNVRGKTLNVAYSPRGAAGAPVSMPLTWEELASAHPLDFRIDGVIKRLTRTGDRWSDVLKRKQDLERALKGGKA